jgi:hypothetical protein
MNVFKYLKYETQICCGKYEVRSHTLLIKVKVEHFINERTNNSIILGSVWFGSFVGEGRGGEVIF